MIAVDIAIAHHGPRDVATIGVSSKPWICWCMRSCVEISCRTHPQQKQWAFFSQNTV